MRTGGEDVVLRHVKDAEGAEVTITAGFATERVGLHFKRKGGGLSYDHEMVILTYEEMDQLVEEYLKRKAE